MWHREFKLRKKQKTCEESDGFDLVSTHVSFGMLGMSGVLMMSSGNFCFIVIQMNARIASVC